MSDKKSGDFLQPATPLYYRIEVEGILQDTWSEYFSGMVIATSQPEIGPVVSSLTGPVRDQSELTGMLNALVELHLPVLSVQKVEPDA